MIKCWVAQPPWHTYKGGRIQHIRFMSLMFLCQKACIYAKTRKGDKIAAPFKGERVKGEKMATTINPLTGQLVYLSTHKLINP